MTHPVEIMAPAGNRECLEAALQAGADSVYFGVGQLNMRAKATNNFSASDLPEIVDRCNTQDVKTYLTLNTVLYDKDLPMMKEAVDLAAKAGVSAVIASDQAAIMYARRQGLPVHISTQANISNSEMVRFYSNFADVMVLARELSLQQVAEIVKTIESEQITGPSGELVRIEVFAHGALCMAVSGKCYLSLHTYNTSANRGACRQNCRHTYRVESDDGNELEIDNEYIMSPKDLCTIDFLDEVLKSGIRVLKIEGRGRSAEYVKTVTRCYKEAAEAVCADRYTEDNIREWKSRLASVYNRGFWDGYYLGRKLGEWAEKRGSAATMKKLYAGDILNYFARPRVAHAILKSESLSAGDRILIIGETTGVVEYQIDSLWVDDQPAQQATKGVECTFPLPEKVRTGDTLYLWVQRTEPVFG